MSSVSCSRNSSFAFFLIFFIFFIIAFSTPYWISFISFSNHYTVGIWQACIDGVFIDECAKIGDVDDVEGGGKFNATRAMMCLSLISQIASFVMYCVWVSKDERYLQEKGAGPVGVSALLLALIGGIFNLIAVCIYGSQHDTKFLDWSYGFACTTTSVLLLNSTITLCVTSCCYEGFSAPPPATNATMTVITTQQPISRGYLSQQQPIGMYPTPQGGGVSYVAPPPVGYPTQSQGAYPAQQYYQPQQAMYPQQQLPAYTPQYPQQYTGSGDFK